VNPEAKENAMVRMALTVVVMTVACGLATAVDPPAKFEVRKAEMQAGDGLTEVSIVGSDAKIYVHKEVIITNDDVASARVVFDRLNNAGIELKFTQNGIAKMTKANNEHQGLPMAVLVDGKVLAAPVIRVKIVLNAVITGSFTKEEAEKFAAAIKGK
jgi:preprotein translocase subunit SecD